MNITPDQTTVIRRMIESDGNLEVRRAHYLRMEAAQRAEEQRLIDAKAARIAAAAAAPAPTWASTHPVGLASTSATVSRGSLPGF